LILIKNKMFKIIQNICKNKYKYYLLLILIFLIMFIYY